MSRSSSRDPKRFAEPHQLLALGGRQAGAPLRAIRLRLLDPLAQRRLGQVELAGDGADALAFVEDQAHGAGCLNSSVNCRRGRRFGVSAIGLDIVSPFGKMSTKPDQVHCIRLCSSVFFCACVRLCSSVFFCGLYSSVFICVFLWPVFVCAHLCFPVACIHRCFSVAVCGPPSGTAMPISGGLPLRLSCKSEDRSHSPPSSLRLLPML